MRHRAFWIRYSLARLRPLGRPVFWAPPIALLFLLLFVSEFFAHPEFDSNFGRSTSNESLSREDQAIGADIDSLPLLMNDIKIAPKPETADITPTDQNLPQSALNQFFPAPSDVTATLQPASLSSQGIFAVFKSALTTELGLPTPSSTTDPTTSAPLPPNRLQEAMSKLASENRPLISQTPIEGTTHLDPPLSGTSFNAAPQSPNSFSVLIEGAATIAPGTAPIVAAPLSSVSPLNAPVSQPVETKPSDFGVIQTAPIKNQQPFTVPRSIPRRTIGGGNINTFSNP
ncbi:MAG: hypothetical protein C4288_01235 [Leptolyngbya sp. ERB_1_1]